MRISDWSSDVCSSDLLGRRLARAGKPHVVVTQAISGNRVISSGTGPSAVERFDRDVLTLPGVSHVVILEGINVMGISGGRRPDGRTRRPISIEKLSDANLSGKTRLWERLCR